MSLSETQHNNIYCTLFHSIHQIKSTSSYFCNSCWDKQITVSIYTKCKQPALLAKAIYTNSTHQHVIGTKNARFISVSVALMVRHVHFGDPSLNPPFQLSYCIGKAFIFYKIKEIIKKLKLKYRVGLGVGRDLSQ